MILVPGESSSRAPCEWKKICPKRMQKTQDLGVRSFLRKKIRGKALRPNLGLFTSVSDKFFPFARALDELSPGTKIMSSILL